MHIDARHLDDHSVIEGDVCIAGAGAAGISIALEWINSPYKVILLEGGGFTYDDRVQDLYRGDATGQKYYPLKSTRLHYFGGSTGHWGGLCSIFEPAAFEKREWVSDSGWPISENELNPYYKRAHETLKLGEYGFDFDYWQQRNPKLVPLQVNSEVFRNKIWRFGVPASLKFGTTYREDIVNAGNVILYTYANVVNIKASNDMSLVNEISIKNYTGKTHKVRARYFILACSAIENARLLMASNQQSENGLGNNHDLVGRYFMENIDVKSAELWLKQPRALQWYMCNEPNIKAELSLTPQKQHEHQILNGNLSFTPLDVARKTPAFIKSWTEDDPRKNRERVSEIYEKNSKTGISRFFESNRHESFQVSMRLEQAPKYTSRVLLSNLQDELGVPRADLHWEFTALERKSARKIYELLGQQVGAAGIGRVKLQEGIQDENDLAMPPNISGGWHHMGTTRMNNNPKKGVVDASCKVHGIENLFVAGSSCFPNGGGVNPTFTLVALAIRLSDHLKHEARTISPLFAKRNLSTR